MTKTNLNLSTYMHANMQMAAYRIIRASVNRVLAEHNLNTTQWIILNLVNEQPKTLRITDVTKHIGVEGPLITKLAKQLVNVKYLKTTPHPSDGRARVLTLPTTTQKLLQQIELELETQLKPLTNGVSRQELTTYFTVLQKFIDNKSR